MSLYKTQHLLVEESNGKVIVYDLDITNPYLEQDAPLRAHANQSINVVAVCLKCHPHTHRPVKIMKMKSVNLQVNEEGYVDGIDLQDRLVRIHPNQSQINIQPLFLNHLPSTHPTHINARTYIEICESIFFKSSIYRI